MFDGKQRPQGLEVPACGPCNHGTSNAEQVAALLARTYPDSGTEMAKVEIRKLLRGVKNNNPGLLEEMTDTSADQERRLSVALKDGGAGSAVTALNANGPLLNNCIQTFGAKLGFALHYNELGRIVPATGGVTVRWYTNFDKITGRIPEDLLRLLGPPKTLQQGKKTVNDQFEYAFAIAPDASMAAYFSAFRRSFAVVSWVIMDTSTSAHPEGAVIHRPGGLSVAA